MRLLLPLFFFVCISINLNAQNEPVLPGDFNMDGVVSIHDALYWGLAHGETGPTRNAATTNWTPQPTDDWDESIRQVNNKFQDGDGNGLIDTFDLEALHQNFDSTHTHIIKDGADAQNSIWLVHYATESAGIRDHRYELRMKGDSLHGLAFTFDYSNYGDAALDVGVSIDGLLLENDGTIIEVLKEDDYQLHVAITRTDQSNLVVEDDILVNIVVCEDIATLTAPAEVYIKHGEYIREDETRVELWTYPFQTPPPPVPECKVLWNGEQCLYDNGGINSEEVESDFCFEGRLYEGNAGIHMGCHEWLDGDISGYDSLSFTIKTESAGIGQSVEFSIKDIHGNYSNPILVNDLDTGFTKVEFPLEILTGDAPVLEAIEWIYFEAIGEAEFTIYVDDIILNNDWHILWNGEKCDYRDGTLNEEQAHNGRYSFERIVDEYQWNHSLISLYCEQHMTVNLTQSDEIRFYAKADQNGKTFDFYVSEPYRDWGDCRTLNIDDYIEEGELSDHYRLVRIPLDSLKSDSCLLEKVQALHFFNYDDLEFKFYIDDVHVFSENCMTSTQDPETTDNQQLIIYPNPASEILSIQLHTRQSTQGEVRIFDMQGRILDRLSTHLTAGQNIITYTPATLTAGVYVIQIESEHEFFTGKFMILD